MQKTFQALWETDFFLYLSMKLFMSYGRVSLEQRTLTSMCKLFGLEAVGRVTDKALLIFGGIGYTKAYPIERLYRDARLNWLEEGPPTIQKMVIARNFLKEYPWRTSEASAVVDFPWCK